jgi:two-component system sensor histidine kinase KdpD
VTLEAQNPAVETVRYAREHNVTKIVVGKPTHPRWRDLFRPSFLEEVVRLSGDIDVYVITGQEEVTHRPSGSAPAKPHAGASMTYAAAFASLAAVSAATGISRIFFWRDHLPDVVMVYLLGIVVVAMRYGYGPSLFAAILSVLLFDFLFVPPYYSFAVSDFSHMVTFAVMFVVAAVISGLTKRVRDQAEAARAREQRTASLYAMSRELAATRATRNLTDVATQHLHDVFDARVAVLLSSYASDQLENVCSGAWCFEPDEKERAVVEWVSSHDKPAGLSTDTLPSSKALYVPLREARGKVGVLGVLPADKRRFVDPEQRALLDVFASQMASALERARLAEEAQQATVQMEAERLRSSLLSSVSHDLRTPLAVITGSASALLQSDGALAPAARHDLAATIHEEAQRLNRLVRNLLDMTRIASGAIKVAKEWQPLDEVIGAALNRMDEQLQGRKIDVHVGPDVSLVPIDAVLIEQVLINLLENAAKYTPAGSPIEIRAHRREDEAVVEVADHGPGVPPELRDKIFEKFYRLAREGSAGGAGLGLAICRGVVEAHGGRIWVETREGGGSVFRFTLPIEGTPPQIAPEVAS